MDFPLDSRKEYTKSDWIMWTAAMSPDKDIFQRFSDPVYKYINETVSRVPISDWHHTDSGRWVGFREPFGDRRILDEGING